MKENCEFLFKSATGYYEITLILNSLSFSKVYYHSTYSFETFSLWPKEIRITEEDYIYPLLSVSMRKEDVFLSLFLLMKKAGILIDLVCCERRITTSIWLKVSEMFWETAETELWGGKGLTYSNGRAWFVWILI